MVRAALISLVICVAGAVAEGLCSGSDVMERFGELAFPWYSIPLWSWFVIGGFYYAMCYWILFRIFLHAPATPYRTTALGLVMTLMAANALWNFVFFRTENLLLSFVCFFPYGILALGLFAVLWKFDRLAAWPVVPYLVYLVYAHVWGFGLWRLNATA